MKPKLSDILIRGEVGCTFEAVNEVDVGDEDEQQFDELLDFVVEELGVDPQEIIDRMKWHIKQNVVNTANKVLKEKS